MLVDSWRESQIGRSILKASRAFPMCRSTSLSAPPSLLMLITAQVGEVQYCFDGRSIDYDGITESWVDFHHLGFPCIDYES